ncbi:hypothetical protein CEXT_775771 [Caerostris extrusa]|uniref:Transmembrane protein n=1 Tax=Caerostris extrusa TaxID=172846 RepID=A0AAV4QCB2_CAEEX|nr:hypothetical protein CEXT_775771 [Caerostris extrusa]
MVIGNSYGIGWLELVMVIGNSYGIGWLELVMVIGNSYGIARPSSLRNDGLGLAVPISLSCYLFDCFVCLVLGGGKGGFVVEGREDGVCCSCCC